MHKILRGFSSRSCLSAVVPHRLRTYQELNCTRVEPRRLANGLVFGFRFPKTVMIFSFFRVNPLLLDSHTARGTAVLIPSQ